MEKRIADLYRDELDYIDNDFFIIEETDKIPEQFINEVLDMELLVFCTKGKASFRLEEKSVTIETGQCALCPDYTPIYDLMVSPDLKLCVMGFSWHLLEDVPALVKRAWLAAGEILNEPVFTPDEVQRKRIELYIALLMYHVKNQGSRFCKEIIHLLFQTFVFELINMTCGKEETATLDDSDISQGTLLSRQFFEILAQGEGTIRSVAQVAKMMNVTPKYLSHVISFETSHPPLFHIHKYTIRAIERQLRYSDYTIKEISTRMGFPSLAFFGKFVKEHLGMSPKEYRTRKGMTEVGF